MNIVQKYLQDNSLGSLEDDHCIDLSFSKDRKKISLNYNQIEADELDEIACHCRGMILGLPNGEAFPLDYKSFIPRDTVCIAHPFNRFFNFGQKGAAITDLNRNDLEVQNKIDGTLAIIYHCPINNKWMMATRSVPEADIPMNSGTTFAELWESTYKDLFNESFQDCGLDRGNTYMFELCTPYNQVVVEYLNNSIVILGARNLLSGKEFIPETKFQNPDVYKLASHEDIVKFVNSRPFRQYEGVVVKDGNFNRVKIKSPDYSQASKLTGIAASPRAMMSIILNGMWDDIYPMLHPLIKPVFETMLENYRQFVHSWKNNYHSILLQYSGAYPDFDKNKAFALCLRDNNIKWTTPYFQCFRKGLSWEEFLTASKQEVNGKIIYPDSFLDALLAAIKEQS